MRWMSSFRPSRRPPGWVEAHGGVVRFEVQSLDSGPGHRSVVSASTSAPLPREAAWSLCTCWSNSSFPVSQVGLAGCVTRNWLAEVFERSLMETGPFPSDLGLAELRSPSSLRWLQWPPQVQRYRTRPPITGCCSGCSLPRCCPRRPSRSCGRPCLGSSAGLSPSTALCPLGRCRKG